MIEKIPFMLRLSKHAVPFFSNLLVFCIPAVLRGWHKLCKNSYTNKSND